MSRSNGSRNAQSHKVRGVSLDAMQPYIEWQKELVSTNFKGETLQQKRDRAVLQQTLVKTAKDSHQDLAKELRSVLGIGTKGIAVPDLPMALSRRQLDKDEQRKAKGTTWNWEKDVYNALTNPKSSAPVTRGEAGQSLFWILANIAWIEKQQIIDPFSAFINKANNQYPLKHDPQKFSSKPLAVLDSQTRDLLRGLGGIPHVRVGWSKFILDCPLARAWWRVYTIEQAIDSSNGAVTLNDCLDVFYSRVGPWRAWIEMTMTSLGVLSAPVCVSGYVMAIKDYINKNGKVPTREEAADDYIKRMARRTVGMYPGYLTPDYLRDLALAP